MQVTHFKDICFADRSLKAEHSWVLIQSQSAFQDIKIFYQTNDTMITMLLRNEANTLTIMCKCT